MRFTARIRYLLVSFAVLIAGAIQLWRGVHPIIVIPGVLAFLFFGNLVVFLAGSKERAIRRQRRRDYYAN